MEQSELGMSDLDLSTRDAVEDAGALAPPVAPGLAVPTAGLASKSFVGLLVTQFLVSLNDNMFRWLVIPIGKDLIDPDLALSFGSFCFLLPFVVLAAPAGFLADRFSKRSVIVGCKVAEIIIVTLGVGALLSGNVTLMLIALALLASQAALFSPAKMGIIPEIVRPDRISAANGLIGMSTMLAIIFGTVAGGFLYTWTTLPGPDGKPLQPGQHQWWISAVALMGVATVGWLASLLINRIGAANPQRPVPLNPFGQTYRDLRTLAGHRPLFCAALASAFFWSMGALSQVNIDKLARPELVTDQQYVGPLLAILTLGIGIGSLLSGIWSRGKVELGIVPVGAAGMALAAMLLVTVPHGVGHPWSAAYGWAGFWLLGLGLSAGLYDIPLQAFLQHRSPPQQRGMVMAAYNFLAFSGMLLASGVFWLLGSQLQFSARTIFFLSGLAIVPVVAAMLWLLPIRTLRFLMWLLTKAVYRVRVRGLENLPEHGGALLVSNHVSWIDGVMLLIYSPRPIRMIALTQYCQRKGLSGWLCRRNGVIPITPSDRASVLQALRTARKAIREGELVCIFPEGGITRTGLMRMFQPGFLAILRRNPCPVIPVYLGGFWGSIFSFYGGKFFWKLPRRIRYPLAIHFGQPLANVTDVHPVRQAVAQLGVQDMAQQKRDAMNLPRQMLRNCRRARFRVKAADTTGLAFTGADILTRALILRRLLRRTLARDERRVGLLVPPSVGALLANAALALDRRMAVNLNYTVSSEILAECIAQAGIRTAITTRRVLERFPLKIDVSVLYLEDFKTQARLVDKLAAAAAAWLLPVWLLERWLGLTWIAPDDLLTIIFTSGSTGLPKGVMLSHYNVSSNTEAFNQVLDFRDSDVLLGILPFFHSFGYTTTLWMALALKPKLIYHYSPLEGRQIGQLCRQHGATLIVAAPTFLRNYVRRCEPEDFARLEAVITGAEKLPPALADEFQARFGIRPVEGYGSTELSPVVSANIPPARSRLESQSACKEGSVGLPLPGVSVKVVDLETGVDLGANRSGMLLVSGPNVMQGYLGRPDLTAEVLRDGWYVTGDVAVIDEEGFIHITGRESRFSKIGGEMVPHVRIEEELAKFLPPGESDELRAAVTAVVDSRKGERIVVLHTGLEIPAAQACRRLADEGLPPLWIPAPEDFYQVDAIPVLGSGKLDLKRVKELAAELLGSEGS